MATVQNDDIVDQFGLLHLGSINKTKNYYNYVITCITSCYYYHYMYDIKFCRIYFIQPSPIIFKSIHESTNMIYRIFALSHQPQH